MPTSIDPFPFVLHLTFYRHRWLGLTRYGLLCAGTEVLRKELESCKFDSVFGLRVEILFGNL